ncbi:hypothetical protein EDC01DRAFT_679966 [Geopyxis carbonaria]|nr:hypothetical protein EDC01DRAFT_679966 [Geopyxis carbonaria]
MCASYQKSHSSTSKRNHHNRHNSHHPNQTHPRERPRRRPRFRQVPIRLQIRQHALLRLLVQMRLRGNILRAGAIIQALKVRILRSDRRQDGGQLRRRHLAGHARLLGLRGHHCADVAVEALVEGGPVAGRRVARLEPVGHEGEQRGGHEGGGGGFGFLLLVGFFVGDVLVDVDCEVDGVDSFGRAERAEDGEDEGGEEEGVHVGREDWGGLERWREVGIYR